MKLLIAEDDTRLLKSIKHIFEMNRYVVDVVENGEDALLYAKTGDYDGLIFDIMMPRMDGLAVLQQLRGLGIMTPALFLTRPFVWTGMGWCARWARGRSLGFAKGC